MWSAFFVIFVGVSSASCTDPACLTCNTLNNVEVCYNCLGGLFPVGFQCLPCDHSEIFCEPCSEGTWTCTCYSPSSVSTCGPCPGNCNHCDSTSTCHVCPDGTYLDNNEICQHCSPKCLSCTGEYGCSQCNEGYNNINGICCDEGCDGCDLNSCFICQDGYENAGGKCFKLEAECTEGCNKCLDGKICLECKDGYYLEEDYCVHCEDLCKICDNLGCNLCESGYGVYEGVCESCIDSDCPVRCRQDCAVCDNQLNCIECIGTAITDDTGAVSCYPYNCLLHCVSLGKVLCLECDADGYYLEYLIDGEGCCKRKCENTALETLGDGTAILCPDGLIVSNGCCVPICPYDNCLAVDASGHCVKCPIGYIVQGGCCVPYCCSKSAVHCISYSFGYCTQCEIGWVLVNGCCTPKCPSTLNQPSPYSIIIGNFIQECFACRWPSVDTPSGCCRYKCCEKSYSHCLAVSIYGQCVLCQPGWVINEFGCCEKKQCSVYPKEYVDSTGVWCFQCPDGYIERDGCCYPRCCKKSRDACRIWNINGYCYSCSSGYILGTHGCCVPRCSKVSVDSDLYVSGDGWCYKCPDGFSIIGNYYNPANRRWYFSECCKPNCCPKSRVQCIEYYLDGWCKTCNAGWKVSNSGCCIPDCQSDGIDEYITLGPVFDSGTTADTTSVPGAVATVTLTKYLCFRCKPGFYWNSAVNCCVRKFHCCDPPKVDTSGNYVCQDGFFFDTTTYCCKPKCSNACMIPFFIPNKGICYRCKKGCLSVPGTNCCKPVCCSSSEIYCATRDELGQCTSCSNDAELPSDFPCCPINVNSEGHTHVISFYPEYNYYCTMLMPGSRWIEPLVCAPLCCPQSIAHCFSFDKIGQCTGCDDGWVLDSSIPCCKPDNSYIIQYDARDFDFCYVCPKGSIANRYAGCIEICTKAIASTCKCSEAAGALCNACENGWIATNGICVAKCPKGKCYIYAADNSCVECEIGFYQYSNGCCAPLCQYLTENCAVTDSDGWCTSCKSGFVLSPLGCCLPSCPNGGCLLYDPQGLCGECKEGLQLSAVSNCCVPICRDPICANVGLDGWCTYCPKNYYLDQGCCYPQCDLSLFLTSTSENSCKYGYYLDPTTGCCAPICLYDTVCTDRRFDGFCNACLKGYRLDPNTRCCFPLCTDTKACKIIRIDGVCIECNPGYNFDVSTGCCFYDPQPT